METIYLQGYRLPIFNTPEQAKEKSEIVWTLCETDGAQYVRPAIINTDTVGFIAVTNDIELDLLGTRRSYIFISQEGNTYQPDSDSSEPDIENCQVIGFAEGNTAELAFRRLVRENEYLLETTFDEVIAYELTPSAQDEKKYFFLSEHRTETDDDEDADDE